MSADLILPVSMVMSTLVYALAAKWYVLPQIKAGQIAAFVTPILLIHALRHIGMAFLLPGVTAEALDPRFAVPAAYGDLGAAILALTALAAFRLEWRTSTTLLWVFNIFGSVDLLNAVTQGFRYTPNGSLGAMYFIPALVVPLLLVSHYVLFVMLLKNRRQVA